MERLSLGGCCHHAVKWLKPSCDFCIWKESKWSLGHGFSESLTWSVDGLWLWAARNHSWSFQWCWHCHFFNHRLSEIGWTWLWYQGSGIDTNRHTELIVFWDFAFFFCYLWIKTFFKNSNLAGRILEWICHVLLQDILTEIKPAFPVSPHCQAGFFLAGDTSLTQYLPIQGSLYWLYATGHQLLKGRGKRRLWASWKPLIKSSCTSLCNLVWSPSPPRTSMVTEAPGVSDLPECHK